MAFGTVSFCWALGDSAVPFTLELVLLDGNVGESGVVGVWGNLETGDEGLLLDNIEDDKSKSLFGVGELGFVFVVNSSAVKHSFSLSLTSNTKKRILVQTCKVHKEVPRVVWHSIQNDSRCQFLLRTKAWKICFETLVNFILVTNIDEYKLNLRTELFLGEILFMAIEEFFSLIDLIERLVPFDFLTLYDPRWLSVANLSTIASNSP